MGLQAYAEIDQKHLLFDGNRAWRHLHEKLGLEATPLEEMEAGSVERFWRWAEGFKDVLGDSKSPGCADRAAVGILKEGEVAGGG
ncbi:MAG: hypothetical protein ACKOEZ_08255 [Spartobacteria bacterium]